MLLQSSLHVLAADLVEIIIICGREKGFRDKFDAFGYGKMSKHRETHTASTKNTLLTRPAGLTEIRIAFAHCDIAWTLVGVAGSLASAALEASRTVRRAVAVFLTIIISLSTVTVLIARFARMIAWYVIIDWLVLVRLLVAVFALGNRRGAKLAVVRRHQSCATLLLLACIVRCILAV